VIIAKPIKRMNHPEDILQEQCVTWFRYQYPGKILFSTLNGVRIGIKAAFRCKRQGMIRGIPDLVIPEPNELFHGLFIELKIKPNRLTPEQKEFLEKVTDRGYYGTVVYNFEEFQTIVKGYFEERKVA
jgi:hypothetical protein